MNGISAGKRLWPPYRFDLTYLVHAGANRIEIAITNTLHNLMLPPRPAGLLKAPELRLWPAGETHD